MLTKPFSFSGEKGCKTIEFLDCFKDKAIVGHAIKEIGVADPGFSSCQRHCFMNNECVSYNLNPVSSDGKLLTCELNRYDHLTSPQNLKLTPKPGYYYCAIKVFINRPFLTYLILFIAKDRVGMGK